MKKTWRALLASAAVAAALVVATAGPATAAPSDDDPTTGPGTSLAAIQRAGALATDRRIDSLEVAITRVEGNDSLTADNRAAIMATLTADLGAMHDLAAQIAGDTTVADAADDYRAIFTEYRVYAVALPQSLYAAAADALTGSALPRLRNVHETLETKLAAGDSNPELEALLDDMAESIDAAEAGASTIAADALAVTPAAWNADHTVLTDIRTELRDAAQDARDAAQDARQIAQALR